MAKKDKSCPSCGRIYEPVDWDEQDCPFCGVELVEEGSKSNYLSDIVSTQIPWPAGQPQKLVAVVEGYMKAQISKAELESAGIPVLLSWESVSSVYALSVGRMSEVRIFVPENLAEEARQILR